jgi:hypothetical protein
MKVAEKGIDTSNIQRNKDSRPNHKQFSAFREIEQMKQKGEKLPAYVMNMGSPALLDTSHVGDVSGKRKRDGGEEETGRPEKKSKESQVLTITYNDKQIAINRATGVVIDKSEIHFDPGRVLRFENAGPDADWKQLKVSLLSMRCRIECRQLHPFLARSAEPRFRKVVHELPPRLHLGLVLVGGTHHG